MPKPGLDELYSQIAQLIRARREDAGLTQEELARRIGVTRGSVTNLELARQRVQLDRLFEIAEALGVPLSALLPAPPEGERLDVPGEVLRGLSAEARDWVQAMMVLPLGAGAPGAAGLEKLKGLREYVAKGALEVGMDNLCIDVGVASGASGVPFPVERAAAGLGILVRYSPAAAGIAAALYQAHTSVLIAVNSAQSAARQRFALAHALGHAVLHDRVVTVDTGLPDAAAGEEAEANLFAAHLLVPDNALVRDLAGRAPDVEDDEEVRVLSEKYKVSARVMAARLAAVARF